MPLVALNTGEGCFVILKNAWSAWMDEWMD